MSTATIATTPGPTAMSRMNRSEGFSPLRSVGLAAAISLHLALAGLMLVPIAPPEWPEPESITRIPFHIDPPKPPPIPPPPPIERPPPRSLAPAPRAPSMAIAAAPVPDTAPGPTVDTALPIDAPAEVDGAGDEGPIDTGTALASLRLLEGPAPRYPRQALLARAEGEVELLVLVGIDGRPQQISIARSSGHASLDRAAREHVERRWVFEPMQRNGIAVPAWVRVPVRFSLVKDR
jgi:protein TonB